MTIDSPSSPPRFEVLGTLASGGMGSVDLAYMVDGQSRQLVAVKRIHPQYARDPHFVEMFLDEIWLTGALQHEAAVQLMGWGQDAEGPYLAMEFVAGLPLGELNSAGKKAGKRFPPELAAHVASRVAHGLEAAHNGVFLEGRTLQIVHRDITPSNVLVGFGGEVKITDFGIAKAEGKVAQTRTGVLKGKVAYMSPEYASKRQADPRSDLYSLGVVLFELLAGVRPFRAASEVMLLRMVVHDAAPPLLEMAPEIDPELAAIVDHLLAKEPDQRVQTASALAASLDDWLGKRGFEEPALKQQLAQYAARHGNEKRQQIDALMRGEGRGRDRRLGGRYTRFGTEGTGPGTRPVDLGARSTRPVGRGRPSRPPPAPRHATPGPSGSAPTPPPGSAPASFSGSAPAPLSGSAPAPLSGSAPAPLSGSAPAPLPGSAPRSSYGEAPPSEDTGLGTGSAASTTDLASAQPASTRQSRDSLLVPVLAAVALAVTAAVVIGVLVMATTNDSGDGASKPQAATAGPPSAAAPAESPPAEAPAPDEPATADEPTPPDTPANELEPLEADAQPPARVPAPPPAPFQPSTPAVRVAPRPPARKKPCTPDSFDYPSCLSR